MHDSNNRGCFPISPGENPHDWNRKGYGIFWTVNDFRDAVRRIDHLVQLRAWAVDMDSGTKEEQRARLHRSPVEPTLIVETRRGYQAYWNAKDALPEHWNAIVLQRLVPFFGADPNARDIARILRVPGYLHLKDPTKPFLVRTVHTCPVSYTEQQMVRAFPEPKREAPKAVHDRAKRENKFDGSDGFWDRVWTLDCEEALDRLGPHLGESYKFRGNRNGKKNILVDGKGTSCFIDANGRIGSLSGGGPTVFQWIKWLGYSQKDAIEMIKRVFPELDPPKEKK